MDLKNGTSIIIIHYGSLDLTARLIRSLEENAQDISSYALVIIDNGSPVVFPSDFKSSISIQVRRLEVGLGYGAAVNLGALLCRHEKILILNNDLTFRADVPRLLSQYWDEWSRFEKVGFIGPGVYFPDGRFQLSWGYDLSLWNEYWERLTQRSMRSGGGLLYGIRKILSRNPRRVDWISGVAMMTSRAVFDQFSGFDPLFPFYYEDSDFCRRVRKEGYSVIYEPRVKIIHELGGAQKGGLAYDHLRIFKFKWQGHLEYYRRYRSRFETLLLSWMFKLALKKRVRRSSHP